MCRNKWSVLVWASVECWMDDVDLDEELNDEIIGIMCVFKSNELNNVYKGKHKSNWNIGIRRKCIILCPIIACSDPIAFQLSPTAEL